MAFSGRCGPPQPICCLFSRAFGTPPEALFVLGKLRAKNSAASLLKTDPSLLATSLSPPI